MDYLEIKQQLKKLKYGFKEIAHDGVIFLEKGSVKIYQNGVVWRKGKCIGQFDGDYEKLNFWANDWV